MTIRGARPETPRRGDERYPRFVRRPCGPSITLSTKSWFPRIRGERPAKRSHPRPAAGGRPSPVADRPRLPRTGSEKHTRQLQPPAGRRSSIVAWRWKRRRWVDLVRTARVRWPVVGSTRLHTATEPALWQRWRARGPSPAGVSRSCRLAIIGAGQRNGTLARTDRQRHEWTQSTWRWQDRRRIVAGARFLGGASPLPGDHLKKLQHLQARRSRSIGRFNFHRFQILGRLFYQ